MNRAQLMEFASHGAEFKAREHVAGLQRIFQTFPDLKGNTLATLNNGHETTMVHTPPAIPGAIEVVKRPKRKMSAAGRKAISDAVKARWARRKAELSKKSGKRRGRPPAQPQAGA